MAVTKYSMARRVMYDGLDDGFRLIETAQMPIITPKPFYTIDISLNYYEGRKNPYYLFLYSGYEISSKEELIITFSDKRELRLPVTDSRILYSNADILNKMKPTYEVIYHLEEQQLNDIISSPIIAVKIASGNEWNEWRINKYSNEDVGKWLRLNHKAINKRLSNPKYWKYLPLT